MDKETEALYDKEREGPTYYKSRKWYMWKSLLNDRTCDICRKLHGKVLPRNAPQKDRPPVHPHCKCRLVMILTVLVGTMTQAKESGVDAYYAQHGQLPSRYLTQEQAESRGWIRKRGNLNQVVPGAIIGGDIYWNDRGKLPHTPGRVWYEADFDYYTGYRNSCRFLYSNDGLMFVTYDHYRTFYAVGYGVDAEEEGMTDLQKIGFRVEELLPW